MALRQVVLSRRIADKREALKPLLEKRDELAARKTEMQTREAELEAAVNEVTEQTDQADRDDLDKAVEAFEAEAEALNGETEENEKAIGELETAIGALESELDEINRKAEAPANDNPQTPAENEERSKRSMENRTNIPAMTLRDRVAGIVTREDVKAYLGEVRAAITEKRAINNADVTIPEVMLELIRVEIAHASRLAPFLNEKHVAGTSKQNILGDIPEAVWTEMEAAINEVTLGFNQVTADGHKVAAYIPIANSVLEDSDVDLGAEIVTAIGGAIAKARDKAYLFGDGVNMPLGIVTRLAQTSKPANWGAKAPAWTDLHTSNVLTLNIDDSSGAAFFQALLGALGVAKPKVSNEGLFWVMNRKTHLHIMAKALAFNAQAALVASTTLMPIVGGTVVEFEDDRIADNQIIGGFGKNYLSIERAGVQFASSDLPLFLQDQTVFKGEGRYDGLPVFGEAFVTVRFDNTAPTTTADFPVDYANADLNDLIVTAAAGTAAGDTVLTVSGTLAESNPVLKYKLGVPSVEVGDALPKGFEDLTSGTTQITAAAGKKITVVELDGNDRVVSAGVVTSVPKTA